MDNFLNQALSIQKVKKVEIPVPIIRQMAVVTPLVVGDDLGLKSTISSPQNYDNEICQLLFKHLNSMTDGENDTKPANFNDFLVNLSNIDKICLLFGVYKVTYKTFGNKTITCRSCKNKFKEEFNADDLVHDDTFAFWDKEQPFTGYTYEFSIDDGDYTYIFGAKLPSMRDHNIVLSFISPEDIQKNIDGVGNLFAAPQQMALLTRYIKIGKKDQDPQSYISTNNLQEILITYESAIPKFMQTEFFKKYNEHFENYQPKFYKQLVCPHCETSQERRVNVELEFFRRSVFEETEEEG